MILSGDFITKIRMFYRPNEADKGVYNYFFDGEKHGVTEPAGGDGRRYIGPFTLSSQRVAVGNSVATVLGFESAVPSGGELMYLNNPAFTGLNIGTENPYLAVVYHKDHLGSTRAVTKTDGTILEQNDYYPFGLRTTRGENYTTLSESLAAIAQNANNTTANTVVPEYLYNGKEKQEFIRNTSAVINAGGSADYTSNYLDYGARLYNPTTLRWNTQDPMAEKYQRYSPYNYCVNNPISLVDNLGDSIVVAKEYQKNVIEAITEVFGTNNANEFSFNDNNRLIFSGNNNGMDKNQRRVLKDFKKIMNEKENTYIIYSDNYSLEIDGKKENLNTQKEGGAISLNTSDFPELSSNYIIVGNSLDKYIEVMEVTSEYYKLPIDPNGPPRFINTRVTTNQTDKLFHEMGHIIYRGKSQDKVIDFNNAVRSILNLELRPYDENHNSYIVKNKY